MKRNWLALLPLTLLLTATIALRLFHPPEEGQVFALAVPAGQEPEQFALSVFLWQLSGDATTPVTLTWSEDAGGDAPTEHRVTYFPADHRMVTQCSGEQFTQTGITLDGMRAALRGGDRHATFAYALVASRARRRSGGALAFARRHPEKSKLAPG